MYCFIFIVYDVVLMFFYLFMSALILYNLCLLFNNISLLISNLTLLNNSFIMILILYNICLYFRNISSCWISLNVNNILLYLNNISLLIFGNINFYNFSLSIFKYYFLFWMLMSYTLFIFICVYLFCDNSALF